MPKSDLAAPAAIEPPAQRRPFVWLLMGGRAGDNNQLLALADALGWPFEAKKVAFNQLRRLPFLRKDLRTLAKKSRALIAPPWPDLVMAVGYASVPIARYIRQQTGGRAKLVHIGNPRSRIHDFDLQITTPQYSRQAPNLLELPFPIGNPARKAPATDAERDWLEAFPRPRRLVAIGGPARFWELDDKALSRAIHTIEAKRPSGSIIVAVSPRTRRSTRRLLERLVNGPHQAVVESFPSFATLLATSDEIYVTADSVSMLSEAVLSGKPVGMIPIRRSVRGILGHWLWERPTGRRLHPDFANFWTLLKERRLIGTVELPVASRTCDTIERATEAVRAVMAQGDPVGDERRERTGAGLGVAGGAGRRQQSGARSRRGARTAVRNQAGRV